MKIKLGRMSAAVIPLGVILMWAPLLMLNQWRSNEGPDFVRARFLANAALAVLLSGHAILRYLTPSRRPQLTSASLAWTVFATFALLSTAWSIAPFDSLSNGVILMVLLLGCTAVSQDRERETTLVFAALAALAFFFAAALVLPMRARGPGFVNPNNYSHAALAAILFTELAGCWKKRVSIPAMAVIVFCQSRTILISLVTFYTAKAFLRLVGRSRSVSATVVLLLLSMTFLALIGWFVLPIAMEAVSAILGVSDATRTGEDFAGRDVHWSLGLRLYLHAPILGFGFATRQGLDPEIAGLSLNAHSGFINLLLDLGGVGTLLFVLAVGTTIVALIRGGEPLLPAAACILAFLPLMLVEPDYLSFTSPDVLALLFAVSQVTGKQRAAPDNSAQFMRVSRHPVRSGD